MIDNGISLFKVELVGVVTGKDQDYVMSSNLLDMTLVVRNFGEIPQALGSHAEDSLIWWSDSQTNY